MEKQDVGGLQLPLTDETEELTVWCVYNNNAVPDPNDLKGVQELERRTNVHINWIPVTTSEASEKQGILFSSGDLPDIMYAASFTYPGGLAKVSRTVSSPIWSADSGVYAQLYGNS